MSSIYLQSDTDSRVNLTNNIQDIIKCYICLGKIKNPCMCPKCQKLTCEECIEKWLLEKKNQCPHCRVTLNFNQLIHLSFMADVANYIDKINTSKKAEESEICSKHQIQNLYYCTDCEMPLCSDCYMLEDKHKKHKIKKIDDVYKTHLELIKLEKEGLDIEENTLRKYLKDISEKIIEIGNTKYKKIKEMDEFFKSIRNQIQTQSQDVITNLLEKKQNIEEKLNEIQNYMKNFSYQIKNSSKNEIINQTNNLIKTLKDIKLKILTDSSDIDKFPSNFTLDIQNPLVPKYESGVFEIHNFENIKSDKVMYSQEMRIGGLVWKLKLYPKGNPTSKGEYISIFLELQSGVNEPSKYYYILELINFKNRRNYFMEYSSNFTNGECWGYSKFYKIEKLKEDGFFNENGDMIIKVHIRPESFEQLSRDLKGYIEILENKINESIIGEEDEDDDEEGGEESDELDEKNSTKINSLKDLNFAKDFLINFDKKKNSKGDEEEGKINNYKSYNKKMHMFKNKSFDDFDLNKNNNLFSDCHIGTNKNKNNQKQDKEKDNKKNNTGNVEFKKISENNKNKENIRDRDRDKDKEKDRLKIFPNVKKYNNSQIVLTTKESENNNINKNIIFKSEKKSNNNDNNGINSFNINNNYLNSINNKSNKKEDKKIENKTNNLISPINNIKLSNMAKIEVSLDSDEEQKKMNEDPFLIPKDKDHNFIMSDDSFDFLVDSMKMIDDKKDKVNIMPEERFNDVNSNNINLHYQNLIKNLEKNKNKDRDRNRDKDRDYARLRNSNNNFERNYLPFRNYYNYYGNGNGQINDVNSPSGKYPSDFENNYKKKYYK